MTGPERRLWAALRSRRFAALKFRRQVPIGRYFVDFFDPAHQLVLELDGDSHIDNAEYDLARERWLESQGLHVLRFANDDILKDLDAVLEAILQTVSALESHRVERPRMRRRAIAKYPSPLEGEGGRRPDEGRRVQKPSDSRPSSSHGSRRDATPVNPSSGPSGHLLPQGEKAENTRPRRFPTPVDPSSGPSGHLLPQGEKAENTPGLATKGGPR